MYKNSSLVILPLLLQLFVIAQTNNASPYCQPLYSIVPCNQGGPSNSPSAYVNDNINYFVTTGGIVNVINMNSGCNGMANNYIYYCSQNLETVAGAVITCSLQSGINFGQGFAIFIDWNLDNTFQNPSEKVASTGGVPPAATWAVLSFTVPATQPNGAYRMRVRSAYATPGSVIQPCSNYGYGECEDYNVYIGMSPPAASTVTATANNNSPVCPGQNVNLTSTTSGPNSFAWSGPLSFTSNVQNPILASVTPSMGGTYYVAVTSGTCPVQSATYVWVQTCTTLQSENNFSDNIRVYPNPSHDFIYIETQEKIDITIFNLQGESLLSKTITANEKLDVSAFPVGVYYISINNANLRKTIKITKN
ncbi:MAG: T9SS type A sorting domain-containing protein [Bacteroidetes bacterium]|nr:T9SS type A sorting domain-containing protein [Bacteroidota bacterium]